MKKYVLGLFICLLSFISFGYCDYQVLSSLETSLVDEAGDFYATTTDFSPFPFSLSNLNLSEDGESYELHITSTLGDDGVCNFGDSLSETDSVSSEDCTLEIVFSNGLDEGYNDNTYIDNSNPSADMYFMIEDYPNGVYAWINEVNFTKSYYDENDEEHMEGMIEGVSIQILGDILTLPDNPDISGSGDIDNPGGDNPGGGNNPGGDSFGLSGLLSSLISGLVGVITEIIPYLVYIGLGVLISTLGFVAINWLMIYVGNKLEKYFKSK